MPPRPSSADRKSVFVSLRTYSSSRNHLGADRIPPTRSFTFVRIPVRSFTPCLRKNNVTVEFALSAKATDTPNLRSLVPSGTSSSITNRPDTASEVVCRCPFVIQQPGNIGRKRRHIIAVKISRTQSRFSDSPSLRTVLGDRSAPETRKTVPNAVAPVGHGLQVHGMPALASCWAY